MKHIYVATLLIVVISGCSFLDTTKESSSCNLTDASCASINKMLDAQRCVCTESTTNSPSQICGLTEAACSSLNKKLDVLNCVCIDKDTNVQAETCGLTEASCSSLNKKLDVVNCVCINKDTTIPEKTCELTEASCGSLNKKLDEVNCVCIDSETSSSTHTSLEHYSTSNKCSHINEEPTESYCYAKHKILDEDNCVCVDKTTCMLSESDCETNNQILSPFTCSCIDRPAEIAVDDIVFFGHYNQDVDNRQFNQDDTGIKNGMEPIAWRVLDVQPDKILVISDLVLDILPYCKTNKKSDCPNWENSYIRLWLNGYIETWYSYEEYDYLNNPILNFYDQAFTTEEKDRILTTAVQPHGHSTVDANQGNETQDKIFLLSLYETTKYNLDRYCIAGLTYSLASQEGNVSDIHCGVAKYIDGVRYDQLCRSEGWMLRTMGAGGYVAISTVGQNNKCATIKDGYGQGPMWSTGIRPAMWLKLPLD